ncbi:electron transfer flavoprotein subunit alpha/FixB family protein [Metabacillus rhizolycopersici]|uniref:Electron transfer flavoprotein subunit alpha/FixB family protein n=1 Tax=Metabacillus rhizolycopersici TaxID=2875709 RepID=A0ABS7UXA7_9BACI|nr:electron transfer flavoprotein subunit alpha/FixB family protein [Metabacillus rhizolycopersici]MBZ5752961.1 electron transfer flavoprotein subunit alpha/FixB family protein [Metabacillus rhizolycopersici]
MSKVLVVAEVKDGKLRNVSIEALTLAQSLGGDGEVSAVLFGSGADVFLEDISKFGADRLYVTDNQALSTYTTDAYAQALTGLIEEVQADIILMGHTAIGKDLTPRVAARLGIGLISDCTGVETKDGKIVFTRPIYAGKVFEKKTFREGKQFATLRPNNFETVEKHVQTELIYFHPQIKDLRTIVKEIVRKTSGEVDLSEAKIIVSGGRGVKSMEGFNPLRELAEVLGGAVGASRGACDAEYCDYSLQIGQTGKVVTPDLYIACGISGAIQHLAGMSNSKIIVAINKDPEAPIFQVADYGIVGDLFEVVPMLTEEIRKALVTS